jgi:citrate lyase subunit beta / citryl-CoA lyase
VKSEQMKFRSTSSSDRAPFLAPLFVPADRPERFAKAAASGADAVIIDLEDAVAPERKAFGREALRTLRGLPVPICVRINPVGAPDHDRDVAAIRELDFSSIMIPKAESPADISETNRKLGGGRGFVALIETARGVAESRAIAQTPGVIQLAFGPADYALDLFIKPNGQAFGHALTMLAIASRASGLPGPLDGPCFDTGANSLALEAELAMARRLGASGKLCIHPRQVPAVKAAFAPSAEDVAMAQKIVAAGKDPAARSIDGQLVDKPILERALRILAAAGNK